MSSSNSVHAGGGSDLPTALKALSSTGGSDVERLTWEIGSELLRLARQRRQGFFSTRFWSDRLMTWAMNDPAFKVQLFRFVDVFPMLRQAHQVHEYLTEYLGQPGVTLPPWMEMALKAAGYAPGVFASMIVGQIRTMANNFIAGTDASRRERSSATFGTTGLPSAWIFWARPASATQKPWRTGSDISTSSRRCPTTLPNGGPARGWNRILGARCREPTSRSRSVP